MSGDLTAQLIILAAFALSIVGALGSLRPLIRRDERNKKNASENK